MTKFTLEQKVRIAPKEEYVLLNAFARAFVNSKNLYLAKAVLEEKDWDKAKEIFDNWDMRELYPEIKVFLENIEDIKEDIPDSWWDVTMETFYLRRLIALRAGKMDNPSLYLMGMDHPIIFSNWSHRYIGWWQQRKGLPFEMMEVLRDMQTVYKTRIRENESLGDFSRKLERYRDLFIQLGL